MSGIHFRATLDQNISQQGKDIAADMAAAAAAIRQVDAALQGLNATRRAGAGIGGGGGGRGGVPGVHWSGGDAEAELRRYGIAQSNAIREHERLEEHRIATEHRLEERLAADRRKWAADEMTAEREKNALIERRMNLQSNALMRLNKEMLADVGGGRGRATGGGFSGIGLLSKVWLGKMAFDMIEGSARGFIEKTIHESEFKQGQVGEYGAALGGRGRGAAFYQQMQNFADTSSLKLTDLSPVAVQLMHMGMNAPQTMASTKIMNDLIASTHVAPESYEGLAKIYERGIQGQTLTKKTWGVAGQLTQGTVSPQNATEALMKAEHIGESRARSLLGLAPGKGIDEESRTRAFIDAFRQMASDRNAQFGGDATAYFGQRNPTTQITTFMDRIGSVFRDIDTSGFAFGLSKINDELKNGTPALATAKNAMQSVFDALLAPWQQRWADPQQIRKDIASVTDAVRALGQAAGDASSGLSVIVPLFAQGVGAFGALMANPLILGLASGAAFATGNVVLGSALGAAAIGVGVSRTQQAEANGLGFTDSVIAGLGGQTTPTGWRSFQDDAYAKQVRADASMGGSSGLYWSGSGAASVSAGPGRRAFSGLDHPVTPGSGWKWSGPSGGKTNWSYGGGHAEGGVTLADHFAPIHKDEIIIPLDRTGPILADAMRESGRGGHEIVMNLHPVFVIGEDGGDGDSARQRLEASIDELFGSAFERFAAQVTGSL